MWSDSGTEFLITHFSKYISKTEEADFHTIPIEIYFNRAKSTFGLLFRNFNENGIEKHAEMMFNFYFVASKLFYQKYRKKENNS